MLLKRIINKKHTYFKHININTNKTFTWKGLLNKELTTEQISQNEVDSYKLEFNKWLENLKKETKFPDSINESKPQIPENRDPSLRYEIPEVTKIIKKPKEYNQESVINEKFKNKIKTITPISKYSKRTGILGYKIGMTGTWDKFGTWFPLTVLKIDRCQVLQIVKKNSKYKGEFWAVQLGIGEPSKTNITKPRIGHFIKAGVPAKKDIREFEINKENVLPIGFSIGPRHFTPGNFH